MNSSLQDNLQVLVSQFQPDLFSSETLSNLNRLVRTIPAFDNALLECRLAANAAQVDLSVFLPNPNISLPTHLLSHPVWIRFRNLCHDWATANSFLNQRLTEIWLEFDVDNKSVNLPIPGIFLVLNLAKTWDKKSFIEMAGHLFEYPVTPKMEGNIQACLDALTDGAKIIYIAAMLSRNSNVLRLNVRGLQIGKIALYLENIGWSGSVNELERTIALVSPFVDNIVLSFDVADTVLPRIGLECYLANPPEMEPRWQLFFNFLIREQLCTPAKSKAVLNWTKNSQQKSNSCDNFTICTKIVYQTGIPLEAKAYLGYWQDLNE
jgi:hypothetical protein